MAAKGFIVKASETLSTNDSKEYFDCIEAIGYSRTTCDLKIRKGKDQITLKNAEGGLLETREDAEKLLLLLQKRIPRFSWAIQEVNHPEAEEISWYKI